MGTLKSKVTDHPEALPCQIVNSITSIPENIAAHLPNLPSIKRSIQRHRAARLPGNPRHVEDLESIPRQFSKTQGGEPFLLYDSLNDEEEPLSCGRVIVFATQENLNRLINSRRWYCDGTFKVTPSIFYQVFTILGGVQHVVDGKQDFVVLPLVFALLESKEEMAYRKVIEVVLSAAESFKIQFQIPHYVMTDLELAIINAILDLVGDVIRTCLFHLSQAVFRKIQGTADLLQKYNDPQDRSIRDAAHRLCALAFVPLHDVELTFGEFKATAPEAFEPICEYFEVKYSITYFENMELIPN